MMVYMDRSGQSGAEKQQTSSSTMKINAKWRLKVSLTTHNNYLYVLCSPMIHYTHANRIVPYDAPFSREHGGVNCIDLGRKLTELRQFE